MYFNIQEIESALQYFELLSNSAVRFMLPEKTHEDRVCHALKVSTGGTAAKPGVYFVSGVHAREWLPPDALITFTEMLLEAYESQSSIQLNNRNFSFSEIKAIVEKLELFIFPCANPDGRHFSLTEEPLWRQNRRPSQQANPDCTGVDVNRNFDFLWNFEDYFHPDLYDGYYYNGWLSASRDECNPEDYIGPAAMSEPETNNIASIVRDNPNISFFIDLHSVGGYLLYNWGNDESQTSNPEMNFNNSAYHGNIGIAGDSNYSEYVNPNDNSIRGRLLKVLYKGIESYRGSQYDMRTSFALYPTVGTTVDYMNSRMYQNPPGNRLHSFVIECGTMLTFFPPVDERGQTIKEIVSGLLEFCLDILKLEPDCYLRNNLEDMGEEPQPGDAITYSSPDIIHYQESLSLPELLRLRNSDGEFVSQDLRAGGENSICLRIFNRGYQPDKVKVSLYCARFEDLTEPLLWQHVGNTDSVIVKPYESELTQPVSWQGTFERRVDVDQRFVFIALLESTKEPAPLDPPNSRPFRDIDHFAGFVRNNNNIVLKAFRFV